MSWLQETFKRNKELLDQIPKEVLKWFRLKGKFKLNKHRLDKDKQNER